MGTDPETPTGIIAAITAALGGGGGLIKLFSTQSSHATKLEDLCDTTKLQASQISELEKQGQRVETTMSALGESINETKEGVAKIVNHITGTDLT